MTFAAGAMLLAGTWRYRSFTLALAAALVLSPIVWLDYFALAAVPLALARPRLSVVWFLPLATWGLSGAGLGIGDTAETRAIADSSSRRRSRSRSAPSAAKARDQRRVDAARSR